MNTANRNLKERFLIGEGKTRLHLNGNNKQRRLPCEQTKPLKHGGKEEPEEPDSLQTYFLRVLCSSAFQKVFVDGRKKGDLRF